MSTVQDVVSKNPNAGDLQPLVANDAYTRAANAELVLLEDAARRTELAASKNADITSVVQAFGSTMGTLRLLEKRFPEAAVPLAEAMKQTQLAMALVQDNPVVPPVTDGEPVLVIPTRPTVPGAPAPLAFVPSSVSPLSGTVGKPYSASLAAVGGKSPYIFSINGLPSGLSLNSSTGAITGTPLAPGSFTLSCSVTDADKSVVMATYVLTVAPAV